MMTPDRKVRKLMEEYQKAGNLSKGDGAFLIFTNPAEDCAYIIPIVEVVKKMKEFGWNRKSLEVNIDHTNSSWREFKWDIINPAIHYTNYTAYAIFGCLK